jgi:hypothetical protein
MRALENIVVLPCVFCSLLTHSIHGIAPAVKWTRARSARDSDFRARNSRCRRISRGHFETDFCARNLQSAAATATGCRRAARAVATPSAHAFETMFETSRRVNFEIHRARHQAADRSQGIGEGAGRSPEKSLGLGIRLGLW